ncbi:MAG TPA: hypothetical protein HA360_04585 [Nanoarchaeota archaeon]|nr:hypothetical protein [Candidatus Woesearchaeota archaeon]HIH15151.1 hypothetical protein [Nanoarchaeota archaeon]HIH59417.1 hypothetical protein [Nanoarchaeota archaeon]HII14322.1 hypothetical protein [Nanoarchaeota archaeon]HIJ04591.1 hypothetical protein [Nanoarchaeota archaeon]
MAKFEAAIGRLFRRVFVCKKCKQKVRTDGSRVLAGSVKCRKCQGKSFRVIKSKSKGA